MSLSVGAAPRLDPRVGRSDGRTPPAEGANVRSCKCALPTPSRCSALVRILRPLAARTDLGDRIRAARADLGWKQKHLAAEVSVEPITVSRWERGATTPDLDTLRAVAQATGKPLGYFVAGEDAAATVFGGDDRVGRIEDALDRIEAQQEQLLAAIERLGAPPS